MPRGKIRTVANESVQPGTDNVFDDLQIPNPDLALAKAELVHRIREVICARKLSQMQAAELLGVDQPKVSALVRGKVAGFSIDRLFRFLNALGQQVQIRVTPSPRTTGKTGPRGVLVKH